MTDMGDMGADAGASGPALQAEQGEGAPPPDEAETMPWEGEEAPPDGSWLWYLLPLASIAFLYGAPAYLFFHLNRAMAGQIIFLIFLLAMANGCAALYKGWHQHHRFLERAGILLKFAISPFYLAAFAVGIGSGNFSLGETFLWGSRIMVSTGDVAMVIAYLALLSGTSYILAALETAVRQDRLSALAALLHGALQFIFIFDVLAFIWLLAVQGGKYRNLSLLALLLVIALLLASGYVVARFMG